MSLYEIVWIFYTYAFLGWCTEVVFAASVHGKFVNRGFDIGPVCPIYGFGILIVVECLGRVQENIIVLFLASVVLTSLLEFLVGFILEKFFHEKWWDYSGEPFNIKGYICLRFSLMWGIACVFVINLVHPAIMKFIDCIPTNLGVFLLTFFTVIFASDFSITIANILKIRKNVKAINDIEAALEKLSSTIGQNLSDSAITAINKSEQIKEAVEETLPDRQEIIDSLGEHKAEIDSLMKKLEIHKLKLNKASRHIRKAFPNISKLIYRK